MVELALVQATPSDLLQERLLSEHLDTRVCQQEKEVIRFQLIVGIPDTAGERTLPAKTAQLVNNFWRVARSSQRPVFLHGPGHDRLLTRPAIKTLVVLLHGCGQLVSRVAFLLPLQFREDLRRLNNSPASRIPLKFLLQGKHLAYHLIQSFPLHLLVCGVFLSQALQHKTRKQSVRFIYLKTLVSAQASEALKKAAGT